MTGAEIFTIALAIGMTTLATIVTIKRDAHNLAPTLASMLWGVNVIIWLLFMGVAFNISWPAGNSYLTIAASAIGPLMALISGLMIFIPIYNTGRERREERSNNYEKMKQADKQKILALTRKYRNQPW